MSWIGLLHSYLFSGFWGSVDSCLILLPLPRIYIWAILCVCIYIWTITCAEYLKWWVRMLQPENKCF